MGLKLGVEKSKVEMSFNQTRFLVGTVKERKAASKVLLSNLYTLPLEHKVDYEVRQTKTDQGDHHDDSDAMKQRLLKIGKKS